MSYVASGPDTETGSSGRDASRDKPLWRANTACLFATRSTTAPKSQDAAAPVRGSHPFSIMLDIRRLATSEPKYTTSSTARNSVLLVSSCAGLPSSSRLGLAA